MHPGLQADIEARPLLFNSFMVRDANESPVYACATSAEALKRAVEEKLAEYNDGNAGGWKVLVLLLLENAGSTTNSYGQPPVPQTELPFCHRLSACLPAPTCPLPAPCLPVTPCCLQ
jgi:hypothetical protein